MKKVIVLTFVLVMIFSSVALAMHEFRAPEADGPVFINVEREGPWEGVEGYTQELVDENFTLRDYDFEAVPTYYVMWDEDALYLFIEVEDENQFFDPIEKGSAFNGDNDVVQMTINPKGVTHSHIFDIAPTSDVGEALIYEHWVWGGPLDDEAIVAGNVDEDGYQIEARIPWRLIRGADRIEPGAKFAFGITLVDSHEEGTKAGFLSTFPGALDSLGNAVAWNTLTLVE